MRVNISINNDLLDDIDNISKSLNISRSAFISACCSSKVNLYKLHQLIKTENVKKME